MSNKNSGNWKNGSNGTKYKTSIDANDGSSRSERITPTPSGSHYHEISKASSDGKSVKTIITADKDKRSK